MKMSRFSLILLPVIALTTFSTLPRTNVNAQIRPATIAHQVNYRTPNVDIAVYDLKQATTIHFTKGHLNSSYTASIVKVGILVQLLHQHPNISQANKKIAAKMIKNSDNTAATILFNKIGRAKGLQKLYRNLKMTHSFADRRWGMTRTTALDQIKLLKQIYTKNSYITPANQKYIKNLMQHVNRNQRWGLPKKFTRDTQLYVKDGWLPLKKGAVINSLSYVKNNQSAYLLVILSNRDSSQNAGFNMLNRVGQTVYNKMN